MRNSKLHFLGSVLILLPFSILPLAGQQISAAAKQQMADILRVKRSLNPSQRKLSSRLILASMKARQQSLGSIPDALIQNAESDVAGGVIVDIQANSLAGAMTSVNAVGGTILSSSETGSLIRARVPVLSLETVAASDAVRTIRTPAVARTNSVRADLSPFASPTAPLESLQKLRHRTVQAEVQTALPLLAANGFYPSLKSLLPLHVSPFIGALTTQGYVTHTANKAVALGYDGTGVRIGVLSDSASPARIAALVASGDLPPDVVVVPGEGGPSNGSDEGTAMMEIIHDMAPGAKLFFATAFNGEQSFADNIRTLRSTYKCDIIVDDISYFNEAAFQDGLIAQAVNDITAAGGLYFSSAANSGNLTSGTSGTWEGDFQPGGDSGALIDAAEGISVMAHNFANAADTPVLYDALTAATGNIIVHWSDALGASSNDYDLFLLDSTGTSILDLSVTTQDGTQDPIEEIQSPTGTSYPVGSQIVIVLFNGTTRALHVDTERGQLAFGTSGATIGHNAGLNTVSLASTAWGSAHRGMAVFSAANPVDYFSSDGPRKIFYFPDGTPITTDNFLFSTNGGTTLQKPDLTAADGVFTKTPGFLPFFGTSAAAPHAAAIAALVKSANPSLTNVQIKQILLNTAVDNMAPGVDRDSGYGITMALPAVQAALQQQ